MSSTNDVLLMPLGVESPNIVVISLNDTLMNIAIELNTIVLLGSSIKSANSEYRTFNLNRLRVKSLLDGSLEDRAIVSTFQKLKTIFNPYLKSNTITVNKNVIKGISNDGITYTLIYFLLLKRFKYTEDQFVVLNQFDHIPTLLSTFDHIFKKYDFFSKETISFIDYLLHFDNTQFTLGSKILSLTKSQILQSNDLRHKLWKSLYVNKLIRGMSTLKKQNYLSSNLDWGVLRCPSKDVFTNPRLISKVIFGENIRYIQDSSKRQQIVASNMLNASIHSSDIDSIKSLSKQLNDLTSEVDYDYGDHSVIFFYSNMGKTLFDEMTQVANESQVKSLIRVGMSDFAEFKKLLFQILYCILLLADIGVVHRDLHLNNILVSQNKRPRRLEGILSSKGSVIDMGMTSIDVTLIDFDKSLLSHRHHNYFNKDAESINEEMAIVFDNLKQNIVSNYDQIFNCVVMYDVLKLTIIFHRLLEDMQNNGMNVTQHRKFVDEITKLSTDMVFSIYDESHTYPFDISQTSGSIEWLMNKVFKVNVKNSKTQSSFSQSVSSRNIISSSHGDNIPELVSSKRKYADLLKYKYLSKLAGSPLDN